MIAQPDFNAQVSMIRSLPYGPQAWKCWLVLLLVFLNWGLEAAKWKLLVNTLQPMNFFQAFKSVLCGVTLSLNTPNRMGEYAGRMLFVQEGNRLKTISLSMAGGLAQLIITLIIGTCGVAWLLFSATGISLFIDLDQYWLLLFFYGSILVSIALVFFYFRMRGLIWLVNKLPYSHKFLEYINVLKALDVKILLRLLLLSLARYGVFVFQYIFALQLMQVEQHVGQNFWLVSILFWILAIIPSIAIAELGIRGTIAKTLFAYSHNLLGILTVTFGVWFINLFLPAFIGSLLILGIKIKPNK